MMTDTPHTNRSMRRAVFSGKASHNLIRILYLDCNHHQCDLLDDFTVHMIAHDVHLHAIIHGPCHGAAASRAVG
jgi:hypothetical protein